MQDNDFQTILERCKKEDQAAWTELVDLYYRPLFDYFCTRTKDEFVARDLLQDTWLKIIGTLDSFRVQYPFQVEYSFWRWCLAIANGKLVDWRRRQNSMGLCNERFLDWLRVSADPVETPDHQTMHAEAVDLLRQALDTWDSKDDKDDKAMLFDRYVNELNYVEIAQKYSLRTATVMKRIDRLMMRLRAKMIELDPDLLSKPTVLHSASAPMIEPPSSTDAPQSSGVVLEPQLSPEPPSAPSEPLHFSVTGPRAMESARSHLVEVWAHPAHLREEVRRRAQEHAGGRGIDIQEKGPVLVERGTCMQVRLRINGLGVKPKQDTIFWLGEIANARFVVSVPPGVRSGATFSARATIYAWGGILTVISFVVRVETAQAPPDFLDTSETPCKRAFVSYASKDEDAVLGRIQGIKKGLPELDIFYARSSLQSGDRWRQRLREEIVVRDVFYLFWSQAAKQSRWVEWEWRLALAERGIDYIDPVPLVSPRRVHPPPELADELHFDDWMLAYMNSKKQR